MRGWIAVALNNLWPSTFIPKEGPIKKQPCPDSFLYAALPALPRFLLPPPFLSLKWLIYMLISLMEIDGACRSIGDRPGTFGWPANGIPSRGGASDKNETIRGGLMACVGGRGCFIFRWHSFLPSPLPKQRSILSPSCSPIPPGWGWVGGLRQSIDGVTHCACPMIPEP